MCLGGGGSAAERSLQCSSEEDFVVSDRPDFRIAGGSITCGLSTGRAFDFRTTAGSIVVISHMLDFRTRASSIIVVWQD